MFIEFVSYCYCEESVRLVEVIMRREYILCVGFLLLYIGYYLFCSGCRGLFVGCYIVFFGSDNLDMFGSFFLCVFCCYGERIVVFYGSWMRVLGSLYCVDWVEGVIVVFDYGIYVIVRVMFFYNSKKFKE